MHASEKAGIGIFLNILCENRHVLLNLLDLLIRN